MLIGGIWHGVAGLFVPWGAYQGVLLIAHRLMQILRVLCSVDTPVSCQTDHCKENDAHCDRGMRFCF